MVAKRKKLLPARTVALLLLAGLCVFDCLVLSKGDILLNENDKHVERIKRDGDVTVLLLDDTGKKKISPTIGLLSSMARTFVQDGVTTEYATHVIGTTVGDRYAHIVSTGSRVFYDNIKPTNRHDMPDIDLQTILDNLGNPQVFEKTKEEESNFLKARKIEISTTPESTNKSNVSVRQEVSVRKMSNPDAIKPAKVNAKNGLPTFTVKSNDEDYLPAVELTTKRDDLFRSKLRSSKNLFRNGFKPIEIKKYETVTYYGFADFMTTVGNTVIIFMPKTPTMPEATGITSIKGEATLRPEDIINPTKSVPQMSTKSLGSTVHNVEFSSAIEPSMATADETMAVPTEPLSRRISETTRVFNNEQEALGLLKTIGGVDVIDSKTTRLTTFFYGTYINGKYTQLEQTVSTLLSKPLQTTKPSKKIEISMTKIPTTTEPPVTTEKNMIETTTEFEEEIPTTPEEETILPTSSSVGGSLYKTYTYLTTFFIPVNDSLTTTSIKSRTVISSESAKITKSPMTQIVTSTTENIPTTQEDEELKYTTTEEIPTITEKEIENKIMPELTTIPIREEMMTEKSITKDTLDDEITTEIIPTTTKPEDEEEVELLFKTLYTTYTYLTTFFQESTTSVLSREEVVTNIVTSTLEKDFLATDPAVAGLFDREEGSLLNIESHETARNPRVLATRVGFEKTSTAFMHKPADDLFASTLESVDFKKELATPPLDDSVPKTFSKTYTYFTTLSTDGSTNLKSHTEVYTNIIKQSSIESPQFIQPTSVENVIKSKLSQIPDVTLEPMDEPKDEDVEFKENKNTETKKISNNNSLATPSYKYDMTITRNRINSNKVDDGKPSSNIIGESIITDSKSVLTNDINRKVSTDDDDDMEISETINENIESSPTHQLETSFTTYTYFTTIYKGISSSDVVSRFETVTNVVPHTIEPTSVNSFNSEETSLPVTFFTTYTYWTTLYKDGNSLVTSREDTLTNVVSPSVSDSAKITEIITKITPSQTVSLSATEKPRELDPTTFFTTFTYFTTSYLDNETIVNSRLETVTNVLNKKEPIEEENIDASDEEDSVIKTTPTKPFNEKNPMPVLKPTGLLSSITTQEINNGETTLLTTDVYGTYIDGLYAQILESRSSIAKNILPSDVKKKGKNTGIVALNEGKVVDADGISTTFYTTKAIGTYIDQLYAQVIESTSSIKVNDKQKMFDPSTTIVGSKTYRTGLISLIEGTSVKDFSTTFYETKVIGKVVDGKYTQEFESDSSIQLGVRPTGVQEIKASSTQLNEILQSQLPISPSPATIESSQGENGLTTEKSEETDEDNSSKKKTFPVIRPFASRPRPTFQPKKKSTDSLATINRSITPTIVATPALKTNEKGSVPTSRNRFSGVRKSSVSSVSEIIPTSSNSRKYSRSKTSNTPIISPSINFRSRSSPTSASKITPTTSLSSFGSSKRSSFSQKPQSSKLPDATPKSSSSSRFRIRPTVTTNYNRFSSTVTTSTEDLPVYNDINISIATDETVLTSDSEEEIESVIEPTSTTESSRRGNNPLLKLRRPPLPKTPITTPSPRRSTGKTTVRTTTSTTTTTPRPQRPKTPSPLITRNRPKPVNGLFPSRGFGKKEQEVTNEPILDEEKLQQEVKVEEVIEDNFESAVTQVESQSNAVSETERPSRGSRTFNNNQVQIRPFNSRRSRTKRQVEFGSRYDNSRSYRSKQPAKNTNVDYVYYDEYVEYDTPAPARTPPPRRPSNRSRQPQQQQKLTPTTSSSNVARSQFTLRERAPTTSAPATTSRTSNFRRTRPPVVQETTTSKRLSRLRYPTTTPEPVRNNRRYTPSVRRQNTRTRFREDLNTYSNTQTLFDGSITVTHKIPTELTIPIVIGKNTEYKQVLTAKPSIEILGPHQYSTVAGRNGFPTIQLVREVTETLPSGVTEITKFLLYEQQTSSITFTPTYIRGRKTSYSHIIPSTIYEVKPEVSTIQPQLANAPLANLLLSQLLLGNLGIQQTANPLLALNSAMLTTQLPVTEYKTKSTTYVTTVTHSASTVLPITFRGKVISTTVIDSSTNVITATEYMTETIVSTPTVQQNNNQLNTLLLPALLQAQLLSQGTTANNLFGSSDTTHDELLQELIEPTPKYEMTSKDESKPTKKKTGAKKPPDPPIQPAEASVVTLYVSGKRPGEFSTVLSTVNYDETATVRKREVEPSSVINLIATEFEDILLSSTNDEQIQGYNEEETQSLESILGDVSKNVKIENRATKVKEVFVEPTSQRTQDTTGHFLLKGSADTPVQREVVNSKIWSSRNRTKRDTSDFLPSKDVFLFDFPKIPKKYLTQSILYNIGDRENSSFSVSKNLEDYKTNAKVDEQRGFDERRFNFATKKMSNGVEVIVAGDKSTYPGQASVLRVLPTSQAKPITLAPSTLTDHMLMMLPHPIKQSMNNQFVTKTYLTTYTYLTTFLDGEATVVSSREKVVSNVVTDELNKITPTSTLSQVTLTASPSLETGIYHTTYTYLNTIVDGDIPLVMTSQKTVANTVTAPHEFLTPLQPSEPAYHNTNTYLNTVSFTKTLSDGPEYTVVSTEDILTQVVITQTDNTPTIDTIRFKDQNTITDVTKTYYVTYTYYNTVQDKDNTIVKSDISISSDVVTEKYIPVPTKMDEIKVTSTVDKLPFNLYATKTYLTTFTYFTTLLKDNDSKNQSGTQIKSRSKIVQNIVTESLNPTMFNSNYLSSISSSVQKNKIPITATATLENGQKIEFTAMNNALPVEQNEIIPTQSIQVQETDKPIINENSNKPIENPKETIKPSSVSKVSQKTEIQKPPKKNSPPKSEQKVPVNSIPSLKPENTNVGSMIDFGKIGSSLTALKPVISAVAGIIQNNLKNEQKTKNVHVSQKSTPKPIKQESSSRAPIYIPVGGFADSIGSETQQYPDTDQRHPHVGIARPPIDASLLTGGIPISPGEVITTNSDVIIGKPSVLGPRPPTENSKIEDIPFGMRPPPPPPQFKDKISIPNNVAREHIKNNLPHTDRKNTQPIRYHENRVQAQYQLTNVPVKSEVNIIPLSKPEPWPTKFVTDVQPLVLTNPDIQPQISFGNQHLITSNQPSFLEQSAVDPLLVNIQPSQVAQVVIPHGSQTALIYSDQPATGHGPKGEIFNDPQPYPENQVNPGFVGLEVYGTINPANNVASKIPANAMHFDIPVSPAGITVGDSESHHVILFDNETGEIKSKPVQVLKPQNSNNQYSKVPSSNNHNATPQNLNNQYSAAKNPNSQYSTPINNNNQYSTPQNLNKQYPPGQQNSNNIYSTPHNSNNKYLPQQIPNSQHPTSQHSNNQYFTQSSISQVNSFVRRPEASLSVEDDLLQFEDGEVTQESKKTPLRPGELPFGVQISESDEDKTPIINGKPIGNNFQGEEQTLSIGTPINNKETTELKPGNFVIPNQNRPDLKYNIQHSNNEPIINNSTKQNKLIINVPPRDDIKQAMNMDEKLPPLPTVKHEINDLETQGSTPQPSIVKINLNNEVLGLSPPPMITHSLKYDNVTQRPTVPRRPYNPKPKPSSTPPPYQFEKPLNRRPAKPNNNQEEVSIKPLTSTAKIESVQKWEASINSRPEYRPSFKQEKPDIVNAESKVVSQGPKLPEKTKDKIVIYSDPIVSVIPTVVTQDTTKWHEYSPISSTESKIETVQYTTETPALTSSGQGIIKSYATPIKPTSKTTDYHSVISVVVKNEEKSEEKSGENAVENSTTPKQSTQMRPQVTILQLPERPSFMDEFHKQLHQGSSLPTRFVTHTQTMSVTITETTVLQSDGFEPSTHTLVLTKTQTSTLVDTVTEFHTLVKPTQVLSTITTTVPVQINSDPVLLAPVVEGTKTKIANASPDENETLLVVMTDKRGGNHGNHGIPPEIQVPDETNEIGPSDVLLSGILTHSSDTECRPECKASKNEICQRVENVMRCTCRPGFARIFMDRPCKPTYTYTMKLLLDKFRKEPIKYSTQLENPSSNQYQQLIEATREGLNRMSMQSDLRDIYHGVIVGGFEPAKKSEKAIVSYIIQLSENAEDTKLWEATKKSLRATNYSLGGTDVFAARDQLQLMSAQDFDECSDSKFHDCSDNARCFNLHGTYTCSCKDGFSDLSQNSQFPGRVCSSELIGCDLCNYHGTCYLSNQDQTVCECFQWYAGQHCQFNLKVLLLGLIAIGVILLSLLVACLLMACCKKRPRGSVMGMYQPQRPVIGFRRYRNMIATTRGDKRAMISVDTGSETSVDRTPPPYVKQVSNIQRQAHAHAHVHAQMKMPSPSSHEGSTMRSGLDQRDRSLTVMIPRAKYRHTPQQTPSVLTMSTFGPEQKAMSYLDSRQTPTKGSRCSSRKPSDSTQRSIEIQAPQRKKHAQQRKPSTGALVSAGFEVSATVGKTKELDEAYVCNDDNGPDFNTSRTTAARTVSVARSFDETTIQPPTRCYHPESHYESKSQYSQKTNDEGHTMVERDLGSLYLTPQSKLYKPDNRGSDTSNFDSL